MKNIKKLLGSLLLVVTILYGAVFVPANLFATSAVNKKYTSQIINPILITTKTGPKKKYPSKKTIDLDRKLANSSDSTIKKGLYYALTEVKKRYFAARNPNAGYGVLPISSSSNLDNVAACIANHRSAANSLNTILPASITTMSISINCSTNDAVELKINSQASITELAKKIVRSPLGTKIYTANYLGLYIDRVNLSIYKLTFAIGK